MRMIRGGNMAGLGDAATDTFAAGSLLDSAAQTVAAVGGDPSIANALSQGASAAYSAGQGIMAAQGNTLPPITVTATPLMSPMTMLLIGAGVLGVGYMLMKKKR